MSSVNSLLGGGAERRRDIEGTGPDRPRLPLRVLIVEDNENDVALVLRLLRRGGYEPDWLQVQTEDSLDRALGSGHWDIVLSDYTMPQFDALRALHTLREQSSFLPFIVISGSIGEETAVAAMRAGASDYLMKSNLARLVPAIERELRESAERQERARTKKALLELQEKFQIVFREYADVMLILDALNGDILHVNHAVANVMGYDERRLAGQSFESFWPPDQRAGASEVLTQVRRYGAAFQSGRFLRVDGSTCPMDLQASLVPWGRAEAIIVTLHDVSERHQAQLRLAEEKEQLAITLRSIGEGVITTDTQGRISLLNGAAERLTGWSQAEAAGRPLDEILRLVCGPEETMCQQRVIDVLQHGQILEMTRQVSLLSRDNRSCAIILTAAPIRRQEDGRITGLVMVVRDISDELKSEEERLKASKLESVALLAGGIAHDFNNILTAVLGHISLAKARPVPSPDIIAKIEKACLYATDLTRQLLTFAKGSAPHRRIESIRDVVQEGVEFALHGSNLRCCFDLADDLEPVEVDRSQIHQVINNLVINAIQASGDGGILDVSAVNVRVTLAEPIAPLEPGTYVRLTIRDHGSGIAAQNLARIFDPYFTTKREGSGLGLATAYSIIKKHNGLVQAESEIGQGTAFHIYLPAGPAPVAPTGPTIVPVDPDLSPAAPGAQQRVLFMDDELVLQELVDTMLTHLGYEVVCAADGEEAVARYTEALTAQQPFAVVILDLTVPGGTGGQETLQRLRAIDPGVRAIVSSGYSNDPHSGQFRGLRFPWSHRQALPDGRTRSSGRGRPGPGPLERLSEINS